MRKKINRYIHFIIIVLIMLFSCDNTERIILSDDISVDEKSKIYTYKKNGMPVSGKVIFNSVDSKTGKEYKVSERNIKNGKRIDKGFDYFPNGSIQREYNYDERGLVHGKVIHYFENGKVYAEATYINNLENGITKIFNTEGRLIKEVEYEKGTIVHEYAIDASGKKTNLSTNKIELVNSKGNYVRSKSFYHLKDLYYAQVVMEFKNISDTSINESIKLSAEFYMAGKEISKASDYLQGASDPPLGAGTVRKVILKSNTGFESLSSIHESTDSCRVYLNNVYYKTIHINNTFEF